MTEYQLDLLLEYIDHSSGISTWAAAVRMAKIKEMLITDIRTAEIEVREKTNE